MSCTQIRQAISASLDGEQPGVDDRAVAAHLARCPECRAFRERAIALHRSVRVEPAPDLADLAPSILAALDAGARAAPAPDPGPDRALRLILAAIALVQIAVAVPALVLGADANLPVHAARHLGSFDVALAVGFLFAAWRPSRIAGLLPVAAALVACLLGSSLLDLASGNTAALSEAHHLTDVAGLVVAWLLSRSPPRPVALA
jgi:predicted anti-sigma-YlaC factor YlaD